MAGAADPPAVDPLPIDRLLPTIIDSLRKHNRLVLRAPPGAGKTTRVPAALLDAGLAEGKQLLVLEPRRIAARASATFVANARGGHVGDETGYRVRFEHRGGRATKLWFLTEGVLGRQLTRDPFLEDVGVVVLDEFHERHLQGDVILAVARELQDTVRPDLKLLVMSATLETDPLAAYLGGAKVLTSEGKAHPVTIEFADDGDDRPLAARVAAAIGRVLGPGDDGGDILVFLPGAAEIRRAAAAIEPLVQQRGMVVLPLHGDLSLDAQQRALRRGDRRKVVLATNVAETSLTVDGVTMVIDSGLARTARFDPRHAINLVRVTPISRAAAEQRTGRAGRTAPGRCLRLWSSAQHAQRLEHETPEIARLDLSATILELRAWGLRDVAKFAWLDPPRPAAVEKAERLLALLGAVDGDSGELTEVGRRMLAIAAPPRLARMLVEAGRRGCLAEGALAAALAAERDICLEQRAFGRGATTPWPDGSSDLLLRIDLFRQAERQGFARGACDSIGLDQRTTKTVDRTRRQFLRTTDDTPTSAQAQLRDKEDALLRCVLVGFADRLVRRSKAGSSRGRMIGGRGVTLAGSSVVREAELFVALDVEAPVDRPEALVRLASAVDRDWLGEMFAERLRVESELLFDSARERVVRRSREMFGDLVLSESLSSDVDAEEASHALTRAALQDPARSVGFGAAETSYLARLRFLRHWRPDLGLPDPEVLLRESVTALCGGKRSFAELRQSKLARVFEGLLTRPQLEALASQAPVKSLLPSGRQASVRYDDAERPTMAARVQELFGLRSTPRLAGGQVPLRIELLAPNQRPVQLTDDLESFWQNTYPEVRRQLRGRYPKHAWPEDPLTAVATSRPRRRS